MVRLLIEKCPRYFALENQNAECDVARLEVEAWIAAKSLGKHRSQPTAQRTISRKVDLRCHLLDRPTSARLNRSRH